MSSLDELNQRIEWLRNMVEIQRQPGNWDCNSYQMGLANGLILALANMEDVPPDFLSPPEQWLDDKPKIHKSERQSGIEIVQSGDKWELIERGAMGNGQDACYRRGTLEECEKEAAERFSGQNIPNKPDPFCGKPNCVKTCVLADGCPDPDWCDELSNCDAYLMKHE